MVNLGFKGYQYSDNAVGGSVGVIRKIYAWLAQMTYEELLKSLGS